MYKHTALALGLSLCVAAGCVKKKADTGAKSITNNETGEELVESALILPGEVEGDIPANEAVIAAEINESRAYCFALKAKDGSLTLVTPRYVHATQVMQIIEAAKASTGGTAPVVAESKAEVAAAAGIGAGAGLALAESENRMVTRRALHMVKSKLSKETDAVVVGVKDDGAYEILRSDKDASGNWKLRLTEYHPDRGQISNQLLDAADQRFGKHLVPKKTAVVLKEANGVRDVMQMMPSEKFPGSFVVNTVKAQQDTKGNWRPIGGTRSRIETLSRQDTASYFQTLRADGNPEAVKTFSDAHANPKFGLDFPPTVARENRKKAVLAVREWVKASLNVQGGTGTSNMGVLVSEGVEKVAEQSRAIVKYEPADLAKYDERLVPRKPAPAWFHNIRTRAGEVGDFCKGSSNTSGRLICGGTVAATLLVGTAGAVLAGGGKDDTAVAEEKLGNVEDAAALDAPTLLGNEATAGNGAGTSPANAAGNGAASGGVNAEFGAVGFGKVKAALATLSEGSKFPPCE